ncbi:MAG: hypothetical protein U1F48_12235 [Burkholderiales bacterium]
MAEFPAPQSASGTSVPPVGAGVLAYALFGIGAVLEIARSGLAAPAPFLTLIGIVAVIVCYVKRGDAAGTWVASHFAWLIRTFWWSLLWAVIGWVLFITLLGIPIAIGIWIVTSIWVLYRVVRGYLLYKDSRPVPGY